MAKKALPPDFNPTDDTLYWGKITKKDHKMIHEGYERFWLKRGGAPIGDFNFNAAYSGKKQRLVIDVKSIRSD